MAAPEYPPRLKVENRWVRKCAVLQVCFGQQWGDLAEIGEISNWPSALMSIMLFDKIPPEWCAKSCHLHWVIVYDFNVWIQQKSTLPKSQSPIQGTTKYERLSKYKNMINPSLRCKPRPAIIRVKFPDYKKGICQKLNQSQRTRQLQPLIKSIPPHLQGSSPLSHRFMVNVCEGSHRPHSRREQLEIWPHPH